MLSNRLDKIFSSNKPLLSVFFTAGYPFLDSTLDILQVLQEEDVDFVEIGFPFSDPVADGSVIQQSNHVALSNGMTLEVLFKQLAEVRKQITLPLVLMGYLNPVEQYGYEKFVASCQRSEIDGLILPDLPLSLFKSKYKKVFNDANIHGILLATPTSSDQRIRELDDLSTSFLYAVSASAVTGGAVALDQSRISYFERLEALKLKSPVSVGFGIGTHSAVKHVHEHVKAAIIGSAFLKAMGEGADYLDRARKFLRGIKSH